MKKTISLIIICLLLVLTSSCSKVKTFNDSLEFTNLLYDVTSGKIERACIIDLRPLENDLSNDDYASGHIQGALSYDYKKLDKEKFITWITSLKSTKTTILVIDQGKNEHQQIVKYLKEANYKKIYAYTLGYQTLKQNEKFQKLIKESTGTIDCGC